MNKSDVVIGMKVVPHAKSVPGFGDLHLSWVWKHRKHPWIYVSRLQPEMESVGFFWDVTGVPECFVLTIGKRANENGGDYFRAEDFEPYVEKE